MKPVYLTMGAGKELNLGGLIKRIKVRKAVGPVLFKTPDEIAPADLGETITFEKASDQVQVVNTHDAQNTLELIIISSDEGSLDAAASSVSINNPEDITGNASVTDISRDLFWDTYQAREDFTPASQGADEMTLNSGNTKYLVHARPQFWIEFLQIEVVTGEVAIVTPPYDPDLVGTNDYAGPSDSIPGADTNPMIPGGLVLGRYPRYYAGEKITLDHRDRVHAIYAHNPAAAQAQIRFVWRVLTKREYWS